MAVYLREGCQITILPTNKTSFTRQWSKNATQTHHIDVNACCAMCVQTPSTYTQNDRTNTGIHTILHQTEDSWHCILLPPKPSSSNSYVGICWTTPHPIHFSENTVRNDEHAMYRRCFEEVECWRRAHTAHTQSPQSCQALMMKSLVW
jgi:hypothetical protein